MESTEPKNNTNTLSNDNFFRRAKDVYEYQRINNPIYQSFLKITNQYLRPINSFSDFSYLPIEIFKYNEVKTLSWPSEAIFRSSGTSGTFRSQHHIKNVATYLQNSREIYEQQFGPLNQYAFYALLPGYLERNDSSLVAMIDHFISCSSYDGGFFLDRLDQLYEELISSISRSEKTVLFGVTHALLDFGVSLQKQLPPDSLHIFETGGMKGHKAEIIRSELRTQLLRLYNTSHVYSEYGMTELLSQAYDVDGKGFIPAATMKVSCRDIHDPFSILPAGKTGGLNIIDLANIDTCSFIATQDIGICNKDGTFEVLGRIDGSDIRGCNLLYIPD